MLELADYAAILIQERVAPGIPHSVACVLDQRFGSAPTGKKVSLRTAAFPEKVELLSGHEPFCQRCKISLAYPFYIYAHALVMESKTEAIP